MRMTVLKAARFPDGQIYQPGAVVVLPDAVARSWKNRRYVKDAEPESSDLGSPGPALGTETAVLPGATASGDGPSAPAAPPIPPANQATETGSPANTTTSERPRPGRGGKP